MSRRREKLLRVITNARSRRGVALMGVCNVTPDSFSDGGRYLQEEHARARIDEMVAQGADMIDVGGESTRPGAPPIAAPEQLARVLEVVRYAAARYPDCCISIDTTSAQVAAACLDAGAAVVNDVSCLRDEALAKVAASQDAGLILSHARGTQAQMGGFSAYSDLAYIDVVRDVIDEWARAAERAVELGVARDGLVMDPGLGFAKNASQSARLLAHTAEIARSVRAPVLVGASRKSFLRRVDADAAPTERLGASLAAALFAAREGAAILRIHDVRETRQAIDLTHELGGARS